MPTDEDREASIDGTQSAEPEVPAAPPAPPETPKFALADVRNIVQESVRGVFDEMRDATARASRTVEAEPPPATDEDFSNNPREAIEKTVQRALHPLRQEINTFRSFGLERLSDLTQSVVGEKLPYYNRFRAEIDARLKTLDPMLRTNGETMKLVHDTIVMAHSAELLEEARDEGRRQGRANTPTPGTSVNGRTVGTGGKSVPTPEDLGFNDDQISEITRLGGPDAFAQKISNGRLASWEEYAKRRENFTKTPHTVRGRAIPFTKASFDRKSAEGKK